ncbi:MAG TPA: glycine zipper 2TM domain-containing protein [Gammaproteobacteria bacterium]
MNKWSNAFLILAPLLAAGCASPEREPVSTYEREQVGEVQRVENGRIVSLTPVDIEGDDSRVGTVVGAVAGGLAGRQFGSGSGQDIMTVIGAVAGGYAGSRMQDGEARADGVEIGLKMDDGREISIVQELEENETFRVGEQVSVVFNGDKARVMH